mgnify:CR=1 FL=1
MKIDNYKLGDLLVKIVDNRGKTPPYSGEGDVELIETASLVGNNKFPDYNLVTKYVDQDTFNTWFRSGHPIKDDILIATVGVNIGNVVIMRENRGCIAQNLVGFRPNIKILSPHFLYYFLSWDRTQAYLKKLDIGSAQPSIKVPHLLHVKIPCPVMMIQRKIAAILSAYDDLIENNTRRIKILEEMAQAIYNEWFVKFRFPGHEKVKIVDSELGKIPEGWEVKKLEYITELVKNKFRDNQHSNLPLLDLARIPRRSLAINGFGQSDEIKTSRITFKEGDILFGAIRPYFHKVIVAPCDGVTNVSVFVLKNKDIVGKYFLFNLLFSDEVVAWATQYAGGTKMPVISWEVFKTMKVIIPTKEIIMDFESTVCNIFYLIRTLNLKNLVLRTTRDLLLPKLISGEIDVEDLDIKVDNEQ